jgi:aspartate aminotransferase
MRISPTLAVNEAIARRRASGLPTVALGFGEASLPVHPELVRRLADAAPRASYGAVAGLESLREAAAGYFTRRGVPATADQVVAAPGSKPLLYAILGSLGSLGGAVVLPRPCWVSYAAQAALQGVEAVPVRTLPGEGGVPDPALLEAEADARAAAGRPLSAVLVTIPDNPTGTVASAETVRRLVEVAERHDLLVISDEIYLDLVHDGGSVLTASNAAPARTIVTTGLSKSLALGGWRLGVARFPDTEGGRGLRSRVTLAASEIWSAPTQPVQHVAAWAFTEPAVLVTRITESRRLHGVVARAVADCFRDARAEVAAPTAGFYLYPDFEPVRPVLEARGLTTSSALAEALLGEAGIATLPGAAFGDDPGRLTLRVATPMLYGADDAQREQALHADDATALPWIARDLRVVREGLAAVLADGG